MEELYWLIRVFHLVQSSGTEYYKLLIDEFLLSIMIFHVVKSGGPDYSKLLMEEF